MNTNTENLAKTFYFGLTVEIVYRLKACSVVRYSGREIIVDATDLIAEPGIQIGSIERCPPDRSYPEPVLLTHVRTATTR